MASTRNATAEQTGNAASFAIGMQPRDVASTTAQMMRLLSKYFLASLPLLLLHLHLLLPRLSLSRSL